MCAFSSAFFFFFFLAMKKGIFVQILSKHAVMLCAISTARLSPCLQGWLPRCCTSQLRLFSALIVSEHTHTHTLFKFCKRSRKTAAQHVPILIFCSCYNFTNALAAGIRLHVFINSLSSHLVGTEGFEVIMKKWATISHMTSFPLWKAQKRHNWKAVVCFDFSFVVASICFFLFVK